MKGRVSIIDLMDRPFKELHELYRIVFLRAEAQKKAEEEKQRQEEAEARRERQKSGLPPQINRLPTDVRRPEQPKNNYIPSPLEADDLEEALEEMAEGGVI